MWMIKGDKFKKAFEGRDISSYEQLLGLTQFRRSVRKLRREPVPDELIEKILEAARWAPSAGNAQPWEFLVVRDRHTIGKLAELYEYQMVEKKWLEATREEKMQMYPSDPFPGMQNKDTVKAFMDDVRGKAPFRNAPCMIFPLADDRWHHAYPLRTLMDKGRQHIISSMASVVLIMHMASAALDLATQWISDFDSPWLSGMSKTLLNIPQNVMIYEAMPLGYPEYYPKPRYVKSLKELVHFEKYDGARVRTEDDIQDYVREHIRPKMKFKL
ncbi:nitroreductase family protein [Thermodesulfobacteriota bacterium]